MITILKCVLQIRHTDLALKHTGVIQLVELLGELLFVLLEAAAVRRAGDGQRLQETAWSFTHSHSVRDRENLVQHHHHML